MKYIVFSRKWRAKIDWSTGMDRETRKESRYDPAYVAAQPVISHPLRAGEKSPARNEARKQREAKELSRNLYKLRRYFVILIW